MKKASVALLFLVLLLALSACAPKARPTGVPDQEDWQSGTIGVVLSWNADCYFDQCPWAEEAEILRYNSMAGAVMAMKYGYVDYLALEMASAGLLCRSMPAFTVLSPPIVEDEILAFVTPGRPDLQQEYDAFIEEFQQTEAYADLVRRGDAAFLADYQRRDVPATGTGETIRVVCEDYYPYCYWDFEQESLAGLEVELVTHFANSRNYQAEFIFSSYMAAITDLTVGRAEMMIDGLSGYYEEYARTSGLLCTKPHYVSQLVWVAITDESLLESGISEDVLDFY